MKKKKIRGGEGNFLGGGKFGPPPQASKNVSRYGAIVSRSGANVSRYGANVSRYGAIVSWYGANVSRYGAIVSQKKNSFTGILKEYWVTKKLPQIWVFS